MTAATASIARHARLVFWDFDGVIKESVDVKTRAYVRLFEPFGADVARRVRAHHETHGGMSRFVKLPLYLGFAGVDADAARVAALLDEFHRLVQRAVIDSPWVPGAEEWLRRNAHSQLFVLVSATPQDELDEIVAALDLRSCFADVFGAPVDKQQAVRLSLERHAVAASAAVFIGDATADHAAAAAARVPFILRRHSSNAGVFATYRGASVRDCTEL